MQRENKGTIDLDLNLEFSFRTVKISDETSTKSVAAAYVTDPVLESVRFIGCEIFADFLARMFLGLDSRAWMSSYSNSGNI